MKAAVLLNPFAGGSGSLPGVCAGLHTFLRGHETLGVDAFGGTLFAPDTLLHVPEGPYVATLTQAARLLAGYQPDVYVVAGGDGLASYVADALITAGGTEPIKMIGVAMGTANVGPIISLPADQLASLTPDDLIYEPCGAVEGFTGGRHVAFGFNDIILGNTLLGTLDSRVCTLSAAAMANEGKKEEAEPLPHLGSFQVIKNGRKAEGICHDTSQIVLSTLERERLYGRAVAGVLCYTQGTEEQAAVVLSRRALVTVDLLEEGYTDFCAVSQLLFNSADDIVIEGLPSSVLLIADGNPFPIAGGSAAFRYRKALVMAGRAKEVTGN